MVWRQIQERIGAAGLPRRTADVGVEQPGQARPDRSSAHRERLDLVGELRAAPAVPPAGPVLVILGLWSGCRAVRL
jgi:hypothetical protein